DWVKSFSPKSINDASFNTVYQAWYKLVATIPLPKVAIDVEYIARSRPNLGSEIFNEERQISYNEDLQSIKLGRFNRPNESVFYAAVPIDLRQQFLLTGALESC